MNLYRISQDVNDHYDTYRDAVVAAETEDEARRIHPGDGSGFSSRTLSDDGDWIMSYGEQYKSKDDTWANIRDVRVRQIGVALPDVERGVVCASFHAG